MLIISLSLCVDFKFNTILKLELGCQSCSNSMEITLITIFRLPFPSLHIRLINSLRPRQNGRHFADDIFKCIFLNENAWIPIKISLKFVPKGPINDIPALVQIMAWRRPGDKPLSEPGLVSLPTHICVTLPQWVDDRKYRCGYICSTVHSSTLLKIRVYAHASNTYKKQWFVPQVTGISEKENTIKCSTLIGPRRITNAFMV